MKRFAVAAAVSLLSFAANAAFVANAIDEAGLRGRLATEDVPARKLNAETKALSEDRQTSLVGAARRLRKSYIGLIKGDPDEEKEFWENYQAVTDAKAFALLDFAEVVMGLVIWVIFYVIVATYYHNCILTYAPIQASQEELEAREHWQDFEEWQTGLFSCGHDVGICFWSCCCPGIRWSDTVSKLGIHGYWTAFWGMTICYFLGLFPIATGLVWLVVVLYCTYHRQEIRKKFKFGTLGGSTWCTDCLTYCCCFQCAVAQEARQTRAACIVGHPEIHTETEVQRKAWTSDSMLRKEKSPR